jgi:hypothetical protein
VFLYLFGTLLESIVVVSYHDAGGKIHCVNLANVELELTNSLRKIEKTATPEEFFYLVLPL